jgi:pimeloyl-ACP methyl ester carboxylesterase
LAAGLAERGVASLRFDLRGCRCTDFKSYADSGHGESEGRQEDLTLSGVLNDIHAAVTHVRELAGGGSPSALGASFGGGICAYFVALYPREVEKLVLINPLVNYKKRFIDDKPCWSDDQINEAAGRELSDNGFLPHSHTFKLGRPPLNEVFYLRPDQAFKQLSTPTLILHGTSDTFVPVQSSRDYIAKIPATNRLIEIEGAQHGIGVPTIRDTWTRRPSGGRRTRFVTSPTGC